MRIQKREISSVPALFAEYRRFTNSAAHWLFRGQANVDWPLSTSLDRAATLLPIPRRELPYREGGLIRHFKRHYYHHKEHSPEQGDYIEWMALMQHYGAPTRLLDCTHSFFAAVHFALEGSTTRACVFAFNQAALKTALQTRLPEVGDLASEANNIRTMDRFKTYFARRPPLAFVCPVNPFRLNPRLSIQQGVFLCPGDVTHPFEDNLAAILGGAPRPSVAVRLVLSANRSFRRDVRRNLYRMSINNATLFPGLEGFARSQYSLLSFERQALPPEREYMKP